MTKEFLIHALRGEQVEQTPWLLHSGTHAAQLLEVSAQRYLQDAELLARGAILCADHYHCDGIPLLDDPQMEAISLGCSPDWSEQGPPSIISAPLYTLAPEQVPERLPPLPDETTGRWPTVIAAGARAKPYLEERDVALVGIVAGPCMLAYQLRGLTLFPDLHRHPESAAALLAYTSQVSAFSARIYAEVIGCDIVAVTDAVAAMLKPDYFRQYVVPSLKPVWEVIHLAGKVSSLWVWGESGRVIHEIASSGAQSIAVDECMALSFAGEIAQSHGVGFIGNLHVSNVLFEETEEAAVDVQRCMDEGLRFPGYVFGLGGPLTQHISRSRLDEAVTAYLARKQGGK